MKRKFKVITNLLHEFEFGDILIEHAKDVYYNGNYYILKDVVEKSPMFFEEIFEKPYEIWDAHSGGVIQSVKRISDGQIFKIGDTYENSNSIGIKYLIEEFEFDKDGKLLTQECDGMLIYEFEKSLENLNIVISDRKVYSKEEVEEILLTFENRFQAFKDELDELYQKHCDTYGTDITKIVKSR